MGVDLGVGTAGGFDETPRQDLDFSTLASGIDCSTLAFGIVGTPDPRTGVAIGLAFGAEPHDQKN